MAQCRSPFLEIEVVNAAYLLDCNFMPSCKPISLVGTGINAIMHGKACY